VEKAGLINPERTEGKQRLFSDDDIEILCRIRELLAQRVNLSGIRIILQMSVSATTPRGMRKVTRRRAE
jgi:MerR family glutamine synthetase transcriptional repressor